GSARGSALGAGGRCTDGVTFGPTSVGKKCASLDVSGGAATSSLAGNGVAPASLGISPTSHGFGSSSSPFSFTVTNSGSSTSGTLNTGVGGTHSDQFSISTDYRLAPLAVGASCLLDVTF